MSTLLNRDRSAEKRENSCNAMFVMIPVAATMRETPSRGRAIKEMRKSIRDEETDTAERTHGMEICCSHERRLKTS